MRQIAAVLPVPGAPILVALMLMGALPVSSGSPSSAEASKREALEVGQPFPDLVLPDLDGRPTSLGRFRGRPLVLHVFASW